MVNVINFVTKNTFGVNYEYLTVSIVCCTIKYFALRYNAQDSQLTGSESNE
jgi:hypothetical protein